MNSHFQRPKEQIVLKESEQEVTKRLAEELRISETLAKILAVRGLHTYDSCNTFFNPDTSQFLDPFTMPSMDRAIERIVKAIRNNEKIVIHGDYDVDGVTSTSLLLTIFNELQIPNFDYHLPNRLTDGYGLSTSGIDKIRGGGGQLIITVDCGITAVEQVDYAKKCGIDVIITDHHEQLDELPRAVAVLNPKLHDSTYKDKNLAGVGVALKLAHALTQKLGFSDNVWLNHLDIAAVGTAADIVPLIGENRIITKFGYEQIMQRQNVGIKALVEKQQMSEKHITTADIVFQLAPCLNAAGRLGDPGLGVKLLTTKNPEEAERFADELINLNNERRTLDKSVEESATQWVLNNLDFNDDYAIVAGDKDWHIGVIGITASRMVESFCRPTILFTINEEDGVARGSARSVRGLNLVEALQQCEDLLESFGGHKAAAGASLKIENIPEFRKRFNATVKKMITKEALVPHVLADTQIELSSLTPKFFKILKRMEPFGPGNMRPVLLCNDLTNKYPPKVVGKNHLKMTLTKNGQVMDAIGFNFGNRLHDVNNGSSLSVAFALDENTWNGKTTLQMHIKGITK